MLRSADVIHALADEILKTRTTVLPDGSVVAANSFIPRDECELIYRMIELCRPAAAVEIGMAYGVSTLCIADALSRHAEGRVGRRLVSIDPAQVTGWHRGALHLLERAGFDSLLEFVEETSQLALPRLVREGRRFGFAFIDGWHTFDHTLVDFFFVDAMLEVGGIVVFDDVGYPAIHRVVEFVLANRDYELVEALRDPAPISSSLRLRRTLKRWARPLARTNRDPAPEITATLRAFDDCHSVAIRKRDDDRRRFDHFVPF